MIVMTTMSAALIAWLVAAPASAQALPAPSIPGAADAGRIKPEEKLLIPNRSRDSRAVIPSLPSAAIIPHDATSTTFLLKTVKVNGSTVFKGGELKELYFPYLNKTITLADAYAIADNITEHYRRAGYFLSLAYVPNQQIGDGVFIIQVVEGYIGVVEISNDPQGHHSVIRDYMDRLQADHPVTADAVESFLLRMNDLPGYEFRAVLAPIEKGKPGETKLILESLAEDGKGSISVDNYSSRFLGPHEGSLGYSDSFIPLQQTTFSGLSSLPADKLRYGALNHRMTIAADVMLELSGGITRANPGYQLESSEIKSTSISKAAALQYQWIRQRDENLSFKLGLDSRDVATDTLGSPLTRDHIRAVRVSTSYDARDRWAGYNTANFTLSQGIAGLGASKKNDLNASRAGAIPDFTKAELSLSRLQSIDADWSVQLSASGQLASGVLYSSEQFGYGGQSFGRAYDASEITGDHGISGSLELRYDGLANASPVSLQPYLFYDAGQVVNEGFGRSRSDSADSVGMGVRFATITEQTGAIGVALPVHRDASTPLYGSNKSGPRFLLQFGQAF
jgi:hemolysin activation/secretion protein